MSACSELQQIYDLGKREKKKGLPFVYQNANTSVILAVDADSLWLACEIDLM